MQFFNSSFDSILITSPDVNNPIILYANPAFCKMTGYQSEELIGKTPKIFQGPKTNRGIIQRLKKNLLAGEDFHGATTNYRKDGSTYPVEWNITPVKNDDGKIIYYISIQKDLSNLKSIVSRLKQSNANFRHFLKDIAKDKEHNNDVSQELLSAKQNLTNELLNDSKLFNPHLRSNQAIEVFGDDQFFDFSEHDAGAYIETVQYEQTAAIDYLKNQQLSEQEIGDLVSVINDLDNELEVLKISKNQSLDLNTIISDFQELAKTIFYLDEFVDISSILSTMSNYLDNDMDEESKEYIVEILSGLAEELKDWVNEIFIEQTADNIHEHDERIIAAARQVILLLNDPQA